MKWLMPSMALFAVMIASSDQANGAAAPPMPCSLVLEPVNPKDTNAKGAALVYKVKLTPSFPRTSLSIHTSHLPEPSSYGAYDRFEGFSYIPEEISWRFNLYRVSEDNGDLWAGRFDDITANVENSIVEVRLSNSETGALGPAVLRSGMKGCR